MNKFTSATLLLFLQCAVVFNGQWSLVMAQDLILPMGNDEPGTGKLLFNEIQVGNIDQFIDYVHRLFLQLWCMG